MLPLHAHAGEAVDEFPIQWLKDENFVPACSAEKDDSFILAIELNLEQGPQFFNG